MKRPQRVRLAVEYLEDRWCPSTYTVNGITPVYGAVNPVGSPGSPAPMSVLDNLDTNPNLTITYDGANEWEITDANNGLDPATTFFTFVSTQSVAMGGTGFDTLTIDGGFASRGLGTGDPIPDNVSVVLDGVASGTPNSFTFTDAYLNNNNFNAPTSTLNVLGRGGHNNVMIGNGTDFTYAIIINIEYQNQGLDGLNPGTLNVANTTTLNSVFNIGLELESDGSSATDTVNAGTVTGAFFDYGNADFFFNHNNNFVLTLPNGFVGSTFAPAADLTIVGGGSGSIVNLGDVTGTNSWAGPAGSTIIDLDNTSGGTINVYANVTLNSNTLRFDDFATINIATAGGNVSMSKGLTIWNSDGGSTVTVGSNTTTGTITGSIAFDTGFIFNDFDDDGSGSGATDTLTVRSMATLTGNLSANLNTSVDTIDVEGTVSGSLSVRTGSGNQTIIEGSAALIAQHATIAFGGSGVKTLNFTGTVHTGASTATNLTVTTSGSGATVKATLGPSLVVNGSANLILNRSASNFVDWEDGSVITGGLFLTGNAGGSAFNHFDPDAHPSGGSGYHLSGSWDVGAGGEL